jgi:hypothetical protein
MSALDSKEADKAAAAAVALARSTVPAEQESLRHDLGSSEFLLRLNSTDEYGRLRAEQLRAAGVLKALGDNRSAAAAGTIDFLAQDKEFLAEPSRQELLLRTVRNERPVSPAVAAFLEQQSQPNADNLHLAIDVLAANGSEPAIAVLERALSATNQEPENKTGWMRDPILRHRQDVPLLQACERLLKGHALSPELKQSLVEVLFEYRPEQWYPPDSDRPRPPQRSAASPEARTVLRQIGDWASHQETLPPELRAKVQAELAKLK